MASEAWVAGLLAKAKNFVMIGEAGSGKTEVSLNLAAAMEPYSSRSIHFFDMDQTKPLMRARDSGLLVEKQGITVHYQPQFQDAPTVASGVIESLTDPDRVVILDIGGGAYGSHMIGQFDEYLNRDDTMVIYLVNPYRPWSCSREYIVETMCRTLGAANLQRIVTAANPNLGPETDAEVVFKGLEKIGQLLPDYPPIFVAADKALASEVQAGCELPFLPLELSISFRWMKD